MIGKITLLLTSKISVVPILKMMVLVIVVPLASAIHIPSNYDMFTKVHTLEDSYSIAYDDYNDEYDIFSPPTI
jgi:hypothetical protein